MKKLSKKGFSLVEAIVSIFILSIVVVTVVGTIGLAQSSISESSVKDSLASDAQAVMDSLIQELSTTSETIDTTKCGAVYVAPAEDMNHTLGEKLFTFEPSEDGMGYKITVCVFTESGKNSATLYGYTSIYGDSFKRKNSE